MRLVPGYYFGALQVKRQLEIDACLDSGGAWNYEKNHGEYGNASGKKQIEK